MQQAIPWEFYVSDLGRPLVEREIADFRLSQVKKHNFRQTMERIAAATTRRDDVRSVGRGLLEVRITLDHRIGRVLFSPELEKGCNVALFAGIKKTQKTPSSWLDTAVARRQKWRHLQI